MYCGIYHPRFPGFCFNSRGSTSTHFRHRRFCPAILEAMPILLRRGSDRIVIKKVGKKERKTGLLPELAFQYFREKCVVGIFDLHPATSARSSPFPIIIIYRSYIVLGVRVNVIGYGLLGIPETGEVEGHIYTPCMKESWRARRCAREKQRRQRIQVTHNLTHGAEKEGRRSMFQQSEFCYGHEAAVLYGGTW